MTFSVNFRPRQCAQVLLEAKFVSVEQGLMQLQGARGDKEIRQSGAVSGWSENNTPPGLDYQGPVSPLRLQVTATMPTKWR